MEHAVRIMLKGVIDISLRAPITIMVRCIELEVLSIVREFHLDMARMNLEEERKRGHGLCKVKFEESLGNGMGMESKRLKGTYEVMEDRAVVGWNGRNEKR